MQNRSSDYTAEAGMSSFTNTIGASVGFRRSMGLSLTNMAFNTIGYGVGSLFGLSMAIESWSSFMGATIVGCFALYIPLTFIHKAMQNWGVSTALTKDIVNLAYSLSSPIVGAMLLNWIFAWTLPLTPILICTAIGRTIALMFSHDQSNPRASSLMISQSIFRVAADAAPTSQSTSAIIEESDNNGNVIVHRIR